MDWRAKYPLPRSWEMPIALPSSLALLLKMRRWVQGRRGHRGREHNLGWRCFCLPFNPTKHRGLITHTAVFVRSMEIRRILLWF